MIQLAHRIILTELCNRSCEHCFNSNFRKKGMMDADLWIKFMRDNSIYLRDIVLKVMGGEPTLHPRFIDIVHEAYHHYRIVYIFTNGSTMSKIAMDPRMIKCNFENVAQYMINAFTFEPEKFHEYKDFVLNITLHCVIPLDNVDEFINKVFGFMELGPQIHFSLSPDTQVNLFDDEIMEKYRKSWMKATLAIVPKWKRQDRRYGYDHIMPVCFFTPEMMETLHDYELDELPMTRIICCSERTLGLTDYNFDLWFCNQTRLKIGSMIGNDGNLLSVPQINKMIVRNAPRMKVDSIKELSEKCRECEALALCRVGCYYNALQ